MIKTKILLAGTPSFSVPTFKKIIENFDVIGIICQPSKPIGRNQIITEPPTVNLAQEFNINVYQPRKINEINSIIQSLDFDFLITMAYGQIIPNSILEKAKYGSYNIHASLLPKYRGASPIQYALANGDLETGITFIEMIQKMDAGDIVFQEKIAIESDDNYDSLLDKLSQLSTNHIVQWINDIKNNNYTKIKQDESLAIFSPKISREDEKITFDTKEKVNNKIRSLSSKPGAYILDPITQKRIKIFKTTTKEIKNAIKIQCSDGILYGIEYQIEGKKKVSIS